MYGRCCYIFLLIDLEVTSDVSHNNLPYISKKSHNCHPVLSGTKLEQYLLNSRFPWEGREQRTQSFAVPKDSDF